MKLTDEELSELIKRRRLQVIVHSFGYYRMGETIISDAIFDKWSYELAELQNKYPKMSKKVVLYEHFTDFDGSTGFDLPTGDPWVANIWHRLTTYNKMKRKSG